MKRSSLAAAMFAAAIAALATPRAAAAGPTLELQADARARVENDEMSVTLAVERDAASPGGANETVLRILDEALAQARRVPEVTARIGGLGTSQNFDREGRPTGWRVRGELVLESRRMKELGALAGTLAQRLQIAGVSYRASRELRDATERRLLGEAARAFRDKAQAGAQAFGYAGYEPREMTVNSGGSPPLPVFRSAARGDVMAAAAPPVPSEGGQSEVVVTVHGRVELK